MQHHDYIVRRIVDLPASADSPLRGEEIRVIDAMFWPSADEAKAAEKVEVSLLPATTELVPSLPFAQLGEPYLRHLEQRILRHPRELVSHVRRILYLRQQGNTDSIAGTLGDAPARVLADALAGALADLFIVLGNRGRSLRSRLLYMSRPQLTRDQRNFFEAHLDHGLSATEAMPMLSESRLSRQVGGTNRIVVTSADEDAFDLASEAMANGEDDVAQELLESLLDLDPGNPEVCSALLDIYERNDRKVDFLSTYARFLGCELGMPRRWSRMAEAFRKEDESSTDTDLPDLAWIR